MLEQTFVPEPETTEAGSSRSAWTKLRNLFARTHKHHPKVIQRKEKQAEPKNISTSQALCIKLVSNHAFEIFYTMMVIASSIFIGVQMEVETTSESGYPPRSISAIGNFFVVVFVVELGLRPYAGRMQFLCSRESWHWNYLDIVIVLSSLLESISENLTSQGSSFRFLRVLKGARLLRTLRMLRLVRFIRPLRVLVYSIVCTLQTVGWAMLLLFLIIYMFGVIFTQAAISIFEDGVDIPLIDELHTFFGTFMRSLCTLFKSISGGVDWQEPILALSDVGWFYVFLFIVYIAFVVFAVLNVVTGVFCQSAIESVASDREMATLAQMAEKDEWVKRMNLFFYELDEDGDGNLDIDEFTAHLENDSMVAYLSFLGIDGANATQMFRLLSNNGNKSLTAEEFVNGCLRVRGAAKSIDIALVMDEVAVVKTRVGHVQEQIHAVEAAISMMGKTIVSLNGSLQAIEVFAEPPGAATYYSDLV